MPVRAYFCFSFNVILSFISTFSRIYKWKSEKQQNCIYTLTTVKFCSCYSNLLLLFYLFYISKFSSIQNVVQSFQKTRRFVISFVFTVSIPLNIYSSLVTYYIPFSKYICFSEYTVYCSFVVFLHFSPRRE